MLLNKAWIVAVRGVGAIAQTRIEMGKSADEIRSNVVGMFLRLTFHGLRHTHATILLAHGVPVKVVSERLGHATVPITLETYGHVIPGLQGQAVDVFTRALGGA